MLFTLALSVSRGNRLGVLTRAAITRLRVRGPGGGDWTECITLPHISKRCLLACSLKLTVTSSCWSSMTALRFYAGSSRLPTGPSTPKDPVREWHKCAALFPEPQPLAAAVEHIPESSAPEPYKALLVHNDHMTVMMERFHGSPVDVRVLARRIDGTAYSRKIILVRQDTGAVVQFALAQLDLDAVSAGVRRQILGEQVPLGRVLISHGINCEIEVKAILKVTVGPRLSELLHSPVNVMTYGRVARIHCNRKPTFDVIEVSAPIHPETRFTLSRATRDSELRGNAGTAKALVTAEAGGGT